MTKSALVYGASSGIGKAIAYGLANQGVDLCLVSRSIDRLEIIKKDILKQYPQQQVSIFSADISLKEQLLSSLEFAYQKYNGIDILINNGGGPKLMPFDDITDSIWNDSINLIFKSAVFATTFVAKRMKKKKFGRIITISSTLAKEPTPQMVLSSSLRAGVIAFMKSISTQLAPDGITVNVVSPGGVLTQRVKDLAEQEANIKSKSYSEIIEEKNSLIPINRLATPEEFVEYIIFLCSENSSYITGTNLNVDGGLSKSSF